MINNKQLVRICPSNVFNTQCTIPQNVNYFKYPSSFRRLPPFQPPSSTQCAKQQRRRPYAKCHLTASATVSTIHRDSHARHVRTWTDADRRQKARTRTHKAKACERLNVRRSRSRQRQRRRRSSGIQRCCIKDDTFCAKLNDVLMGFARVCVCLCGCVGVYAEEFVISVAPSVPVVDSWAMINLMCLNKSCFSDFAARVCLSVLHSDSNEFTHWDKTTETRLFLFVQPSALRQRRSMRPAKLFLLTVC